MWIMKSMEGWNEWQNSQSSESTNAKHSELCTGAHDMTYATANTTHTHIHRGSGSLSVTTRADATCACSMTSNGDERSHARESENERESVSAWYAHMCADLQARYTCHPAADHDDRVRHASSIRSHYSTSPHQHITSHDITSSIRTGHIFPPPFHFIASLLHASSVCAHAVSGPRIASYHSTHRHTAKQSRAEQNRTVWTERGALACVQ